jgi:peptide/nickel transport system substrate-binding protein
MSEIQESINNVVDAPSGVSRRRFIQGAAAASAGAAVIGLSSCGGSDSGASKGINGTTLRIATGKQVHPAAPWETSDGSLFILSVVGEWLCYQLADGTLEPRIAESWEPNADATSWTFKIREGVMFNDGTPLTVDDVVYTFTSIFTADPSRSKGAFEGTLAPEGVVKVDETTVRFDLLKSTGNFPYSVSSMTYGMCIIKNGADGGKAWTDTMIAAGPWKMESYVETEKTVFVKNENYWD